MKVASYLRVSSRGQVEKDGFPRQRETIAAFCQAHKLEIFEECVEKGISGDVDGVDRPAFSDLLEKIPHLAVNGIEIEAIVVERADRLARSLIVSETLLLECRKHGLKVFTADRGDLLDIASATQDPMLVLVRQIIAAVSEFEKNAMVKKLRLARERKARATGKACGQTQPFGALPGEREVMEYILSLWEAKPRPSYWQLARHLQEVEVRNRSGGYLSAPQLHGLLKRHFLRQSGLKTDTI
jgi:DNA invertase Pin-like site-specific DNA recombinase